MERRRHHEPHMALVLAGGYEEVGDNGRWRVGPGDIIAHASFGGHANTIGPYTEVLRLPAPRRAPWRRARCHDADRVVRLAEKNISDAASLALSSSVMAEEACNDWPDLLARRLAEDSEISICAWARDNGVAREHLSRSFQLLYRTSPKRFRAECRARRAWSAIIETDEALASIAAGLGFSDQAHMTRDVRALCGMTPAALRAASH
jgi:AraC-like DNA-binding protein